jgi:hypothetical protein
MEQELVQHLDQQSQEALDGFQVEFVPGNLDQLTLERRLDEEVDQIGEIQRGIYRRDDIERADSASSRASSTMSMSNMRALRRNLWLFVTSLDDDVNPLHVELISWVNRRRYQDSNLPNFEHWLRQQIRIDGLGKLKAFIQQTEELDLDSVKYWVRRHLANPLPLQVSLWVQSQGGPKGKFLQDLMSWVDSHRKCVDDQMADVLEWLESYEKVLLEKMDSKQPSPLSNSPTFNQGLENAVQCDTQQCPLALFNYEESGLRQEYEEDSHLEESLEMPPRQAKISAQMITELSNPRPHPHPRPPSPSSPPPTQSSPPPLHQRDKSYP